MPHPKERSRQTVSKWIWQSPENLLSLVSLHAFKILSSSCAVTLSALPTLPYISLSAPVLENSPKVVLDEAWQIVNRSYVDPQFNHVNWLQVRQQLLARSYSTPEAAYTALREALKQLNDPYTRFLDPQEFQALNSNDIDGELTGVGLQLQADAHALKVVKALAGTPAIRAGIQPGDSILAIDGQSTQGMPAETATRLIRGAENTTVKLVLSRSHQSAFTVTLTRQRLEVPVVYSALRQEGNQRIGYIRLDEFSGHAATQMQQAIADLDRQKVDRFVLDLRGNPGGLLNQETEIARMWLDQGTIVRIVDRNGHTQEITANHTALTNRPLVVLVDGGSASASEILTGALKDNHRAIAVGTKTFGKALVQSVNPLSDGSGINVTIAHYFTPAGLDINHQGIQPDVVAPLTQQQQQELSSHPDELGTDHDPQYETAIHQGATALAH